MERSRSREILVAVAEELQDTHASDVFVKRILSKEVIVVKEGDTFVFHAQMERSSWQEKIQRDPHIQ